MTRLLAPVRHREYHIYDSQPDVRRYSLETHFSLVHHTIPLYQAKQQSRQLQFRPTSYTAFMAAKLETEIKLRVRDLPELLRRLRQIGAREHRRVFEENVLYDTPASDLRRLGRLLRLRIETPKSGRHEAILTAKAPAPEKSGGGRRKPSFCHKQKLEREVPVRDHRRIARLLRAIGLGPSFRYEKYRTSFRLRDLHLDLDQTPAGTFLELEGSPAAIDRAARALGYSQSDYIRGTYWDLYAADCLRHGRKPKNMVFGHKKAHSFHSSLDNLSDCF